VDELVRRGHDVSAFVRRPEARAQIPAGARVLVGDVMREPDVDAAVRGHDAVVVTLGIREPALRVRLFGSRATPLRVRSEGTARVIAAMRRHAVPRLLVQTSFGVGPTRGRLPWQWRLIFAALLAPQIADTERQEQLVRTSGLQWVIAQPVALTDDEPSRPALASPDGAVRGMQVSRRAVAAFLADAVAAPALVGRTVALS
jgi:uncharacterized protein YbjT (DUF2867 family)